MEVLHIPRLTRACQHREQRALEGTHMQACPVTASRVLSPSGEAEGRPLDVTAEALWMMGRAYLCKVHGQGQTSQDLCELLRCPLEYSGTQLQKYHRGSIRDAGSLLVIAWCPCGGTSARWLAGQQEGLDEWDLEQLSQGQKCD